jgi:osmotically-inducible protein OsmY
MEHRGPLGSRYEDEEERRWEFSRGPGDEYEPRRYRGRGYESGYYAGGRRPLNRMDDRGFFDRASDEVRSWFGDEDAERRRRHDVREAYGQERGGGYDPRWGEERGPRAGGWTEGSWGPGGLPRGPYAGLGPRGYQRSDERIREEVCERLCQHGMLDASDIEVSVTAAEVTLRGTAPSRWAKREAEDLAETVSGVRDVHNEIRVASSPGSPETSPPGREMPRGRAA